jgi:hypothetical protein
MLTFLAYAEPVPGRIYPLVPTFLELERRGHRVVVRTGVAEAKLLRSIGIEAALLAPELVRFEPRDWRARTRLRGAHGRAQPVRRTGRRAGPRPPGGDRAGEARRGHPGRDVLGRRRCGRAIRAPVGLLASIAVPIPSRDAPPFGLGLALRHDLLGRIRDRIAHRLTIGTLERIIAKLADPGIKVGPSPRGLVSSPSPVSSVSGPAFATVARAVQETRGEASPLIVPYLSGPTDSRFWSAAGTRNVYRFTPFLYESDWATRAHGKDERISVETLANGVRFYVQLIRDAEDL